MRENEDYHVRVLLSFIMPPHLISKDVQRIVIARSLRLQLVLLLIIAVCHCWVVGICC